jgi:glycosyltransferase involved in cell wall biosynthesis
MRIAMLTPAPLDPGRPRGGVESATVNLLEGLAAFDDVEIHAVTSTPEVQRELEREHRGVHYHYLPTPGRLETLSLYAYDRYRIGRKLRMLRPDVVHGDVGKYGFIALKAGFPTVMSVHGIALAETRHLRSPINRLRTTLNGGLIERYCVRHARTFIQQTSYPQRFFGSLLQARIYMIANPIADVYFLPASAPTPDRLLYVAWVTPLKRLLDLIEAVGRLAPRFPNLELRVAGGTPDPVYLKEVQARIAALGVERHITFLGSLTPEQLRDEYRTCALLVHPSGQENSPMAIAEAMAAGRPAVATNVGGVTDLIDHGATGFVIEVGDIDALARAIAAVLSDGALQQQMGRRAREKAESKYRIAVVAAQVRQVYRDVVEAQLRNVRGAAAARV